MWLKGLLVFFWLVFVPFTTGSLFLTGREQTRAGVCRCLAYGYLVLFSAIEICFVPMILTRQAFHTAVYLTACILGALAILALLLRRHKMMEAIQNTFRSLRHQSLFLYVALLLILAQALAYVFFMTIDLDDAYYVATAATSVECDTMYLHDPYTGALLHALPSRYALSPMPMLIAFLAKCTGFHAAVIAHTILPFFLVGLAYMIYFLLGNLLFAGKKDSVGLFLVLLSAIHICSYYSVYTQGTFLLIRIWQGKAVLASALLPFLFYICYKLYTPQREKGDGIVLLLAVVSCCMVSSMGIALAPVMAGCFAVIFGLLRRNWAYALRLVLCCTPCLILALIYIYIL